MCPPITEMFIIIIISSSNSAGGVRHGARYSKISPKGAFDSGEKF